MVEKDCASVSSSPALLKMIERDDVEDVETLNESQAFVNVVILLHCPENFYLAAALNEIVSHCNTASVVKEAKKFNEYFFIQRRIPWLRANKNRHNQEQTFLNNKTIKP